MQELSLKAGAIASYQLDYSIASYDETGASVGDRVHFPMGAEAVLDVRNWNLGVEDTFYYGDNQMIYRSISYADISSATVYSGTVYSGQTFYYTRRGYPSWYNRLELYWQPLNSGFVSTRVSAVSHFIMPSGEEENRIGPFIGMQAKASILFNLDTFRHPRENATGGRRSRQARQSQPVPSGPAISL